MHVQARTAIKEQYASKGVQYCGVDTSVPGEYVVTYTAQQVCERATDSHQVLLHVQCHCSMY
jgi:hypothetical protein